MSRPFWVLGLSFLVVACDAADPGVENLTRGEFKEGGTPLGDAATAGDSGAKDGGDAGGDGSSATNAFTGAGTFTSSQPATSAVDYHNNNAVGVTPGKDQDCLGCHKMGGAGTEFLFAGTIFQDNQGTTPAAGVEIRVRGSDGKAYSAHSDADGNFWYKPGTGEALAYPAQDGARNATQTALMVSTATASSCNAGGCHDGTTQPSVHVP